jgi:glycosidase
MIYYGEEIEMEGGHDPENRGPMEWEKVSSPPRTYHLYRRLNETRNSKTALRKGEFTVLRAGDPSLITFKRHTESIDELIVSVINTSERNVRTRVYLQEGFLMNGTAMRDILTGKTLSTSFGSLEANIEPGEALILEPVIDRTVNRYSPYKRI